MVCCCWSGNEWIDDKREGVDVGERATNNSSSCNKTLEDWN